MNQCCLIFNASYILYIYYIYTYTYIGMAIGSLKTTYSDLNSSYLLKWCKILITQSVSSQYHSMYLLTGWICMPGTAHKLIINPIIYIIITCVLCYCMCIIKRIFVRASCWEASWSLGEFSPVPVVSLSSYCLCLFNSLCLPCLPLPLPPYWERGEGGVELQA